MKLRAYVSLGLLALGSGCAEPAATLELALWQPVTLDDGSDADFLAESSAIDLWLTVEGVVSHSEFRSADEAVLPSVRLPRDDSEVRAQLKVTDHEGRVAVADTGTLIVSWGAGAVRASAVLAPPLRAHVLVDDAHMARAAAVCASDDGTVALLGGNAGTDAAPDIVATTTLVSSRERRTTDGPALPVAAAGGACRVTPDGEMWALFGCGDDGDALTLWHAPAGGAFSAVEPPPSGRGCGVDIASDDDGLWLALGDRVERRKLDGSPPRPVELDEPRFGGRLVIVDDGVLVVGGSLSPGADSARTDVAYVTDGLEVQELVTPPLHPAQIQGAFGVTDEGVVSLSTTGASPPLLRADDVGDPVGAVAPFGGDGLAVLSRDGATLRLYASTGESLASLVLEEAMPDARLFADRGGAVRVVGDAQGIIRVVVPPLPALRESE